eukprot:3882046-Alexandrium_andersonii.AAC.1
MPGLGSPPGSRKGRQPRPLRCSRLQSWLPAAPDVPGPMGRVLPADWRQPARPRPERPDLGHMPP